MKPQELSAEERTLLRKQRLYVNICLNMMGRSSYIDEAQINTIWHFNKVPKKLPESPYVGVILQIPSGLKGVIIFSSAVHTDYYPGNDVQTKYQWVCEKKQRGGGMNTRLKRYLNPMGPYPGQVRKKRLVRCKSGVDKIIVI